MAASISPYATAIALNRPAPTHVAEGVYNADRVQAYSTYQDIWNNIPEAFAELLRQGDDPLARRYIPVVRALIEATNRYLGQDFETGWTPFPGVTVSDDQMLEFKGRLDKLWAREEVPIKFLSHKRALLVKGDALLMISADPNKEEGTRIRITEVEADQYFPILDPADGERVIGCYLASIVQDDAGDDIVQRIEYRKLGIEQAPEFAAAPGQILYRVGFYEQDGWDDRDEAQELAPVDPPAWAVPAEPVAGAEVIDLATGVALPALITSIPVYHFRNRRRGGLAGRFGVSEIQGLESLLAGVIQGATDEDMAIALQGIGVYWTDSGRPKDVSGKEVDWEIGPASILELEKDGKFGRVPGVNSVQPLQDHLDFLQRTAREANAVPDVAVGRIDAQTAASGVALRIEFMPVIANNAEKEAELASKWTQLLFDLTQMWFPAYESWTPLALQSSVHFGDPLPIDRAAVILEVTTLVTAGIVSKEWAIGYLAEKLGYEFPSTMLADVQAAEQAQLDALGGRIDAAAAGGTEDGAVPPQL